MDITYGEGEYEKAAEKANLMLETYPDLKVMCCLSTEGIKAAADVVKARGQASKVQRHRPGTSGPDGGVCGSDPEDICPGTLYMEPHGPGKGGRGMCALELSEGCIEERGTRSCFWEAGHTPWITVMTGAGGQ